MIKKILAFYIDFLLKSSIIYLVFKHWSLNIHKGLELTNIEFEFQNFHEMDRSQ